MSCILFGLMYLYINVSIHEYCVFSLYLHKNQCILFLVIFLEIIEQQETAYLEKNNN